MVKYSKIQTVFIRDLKNNNKTVIEGRYSAIEFEYLKDCDWEWTEKVDGTNIRVMYKDNKITFGGKSDNALIPAKLVTALQHTFNDPAVFGRIFDGTDVCLYGEGFGAGIQSGGKYRADQGFVLFDVKIGEWWLKRKDVLNVARKLGIETVPVILIGNIGKAVDTVKTGVVSRWGDAMIEGLVGRPVIGLKNRKGNRIITKIKYNDFVG